MNDGSCKVIIVDEASFVSTRQIKDFLSLTEKLEPARVALVGDRMQLSAVEAGAPFEQMQRSGLETGVMDQIGLRLRVVVDVGRKSVGNRMIK